MSKRPGYIAATGVSLAVALGLLLLGGGRPAAFARGSAPQRTESVSRPETPSHAHAAVPRPSSRRATTTAKRDVVVRAPWGSGIGELGHKQPAEGAAEGPMGMAVDSHGRVHVLDQINGRIQIFEPGKAPRAVELPTDTYEDIVVDGRDRALVLDRLATGTIAVVDPSGSVTHTIPIAGEGLSEGGAATALIATDEGTWIESEHQRLVRVADATGVSSTPRTIIPGRPMLDKSSFMRAWLERPSGVAVATLDSDGSVKWKTRLTFDVPVVAIRALESDAAGRLYVAVHMWREAPRDGFKVEDEKLVLVVLSPSGQEVGTVELTPPTLPDDQFRPIRVSPDGAIYQLVCTEEGAIVERVVL